MTEYTDFIYCQIEEIVKQSQRHLRRGVCPKDVKARLPYTRAEGSVRRDMLDMYRRGRLVRVGGDGARQGYRVPNLVEKICFAVTGMYPYGAERVVPGLRMA